jgi:hypothetical protein
LDVLLGAKQGLLDLFDTRLLIAGGMLSGSLLLFAIILVLVKRWRKKQEVIMPSTHEQLNSYRELFEEGNLSKEEFERIRTRLLERMRKETGLSEKPHSATAAATPEVSAEGPPAAAADNPPADTQPEADGKAGEDLKS